MKGIIKFFDILEDKIRAHLSRFPIPYAIIAGVGIVFFWRGVWHTADQYSLLTGPVSIVIGLIILGLTGALVSAFIGNRIILTGLKGEKKLEEKTRKEILEEESEIKGIEHTLVKMEKEIKEIHSDMHTNEVKHSHEL